MATANHSVQEPEQTIDITAEQSASNSYRQPTELVVREIIETLLLTFFIFWLVHSLIGRYRIDGSSMNPTLQDGEYLIINNLGYLLDEPEKGDIVVFRHPRNELNLIKRVVGVPGDQVEINNRTVWINGEVQEEPFIADSPNYGGSWVVPDGQYFVLGDNRNNSSDSHSWGFLTRREFVGEGVVCLLAPERLGRNYPFCAGGRLRWSGDELRTIGS